MPATTETESTVDLSSADNREESAESRTIEARMEVRDKVAQDIEAFLSRGGAISEIAPDVTADPPKKPESNYGSRAI